MLKCIRLGVIVSAVVTALAGTAVNSLADKSGNKAQKAYDNHQAKKQQSKKSSSLC